MNAPIVSAAAVGTAPQAPSLSLNNGGRPSRRDRTTAQSVWSAPPGRRFGWRQTRAAASRRTPKRSASFYLVLLALCGGPLSAFAQSFGIPWHTLDGGGGTSTGGVFTISGTIGQPDAGGPMTGGVFSVTGGFWALPTLIQTPGAPTLYITNAAPGWATLWWTPPSGTNWILQERLSLSAGAWTNSPSGWTNPVVASATLPSKFYRLFKR